VSRRCGRCPTGYEPNRLPLHHRGAGVFRRRRPTLRQIREPDMSPQPAAQPMNGGVDLGAVKAQAHMREQLEAQRPQLETQLLTQLGLMCPCGQRIRGVPTLYFVIAEGEIPTPQGPMPGLNLNTFTCCSRECTVAEQMELQAIARRDGPAGRVTWLDELR